MNESNSISDPNRGIIVTFAMFFPTLVTLIYFDWLANQDPDLQRLAYGIGKTIQFCFPILIVGFIAKKFWANNKSRLPNSAISNNKSWRFHLIAGTLFGVAVVVVMNLMFSVLISGTDSGTRLAETVATKVSNFGIDSSLKFFGLGFFYAVFHSFLEEYYWRWFVFGMIRERRTFWFAAITSSLGFMAHHVVVLAHFFGWDSWLTYVLSAAIAVGGVFWSWLYERSGTLSWPWFSHLIVDAGIFLLGYGMIKVLF